MSNSTQKAIALIPARGGSKRFPGKNIARFIDKPLLCWTLEAAMASNCFEKIVVSSDDDETLEIANRYNNPKVEAIKRSDALSADNATSAMVLNDLLDQCDARGEAYDCCAILLPTCPLRSGADIVNAFELLDSETDAVVSMKASPCIPEFVFTLDGHQKAAPLVKNSALFKGISRRQDYQEMFYPNGAIYLSWTSTYRENESFYTQNFKIYAMPEYRSVDIDVVEDLTLAEAYWKDYINGQK
jgi:CMP-N-acetylneuraminic acid synthetase